MLKSADVVTAAVDAADEVRKSSPIPAPPPPGAKHATLLEGAGYLRLRRGALDEIRRTDPSFPKPFMVGDQPRFIIAEIDAWIAAQPRGYSRRGGLRESTLRGRR